MTPFLIILHILVSIFLTIFVLLQPGARGGMGAAFGGAGGQTVFGGRGANTFLAKLTAASAVIFMITSISLSYFVAHTTSVMKREVPAQTADDKKNGAKDEAAKTDGAKATGATPAPAAPAPATPAATPAPAAPAPATPAAPAPGK